MKKNWKLSTAAIALSIFGAGVSIAQAQETAPDRTIEDIVVTASRREEAVNKVPIAVQALGGESIQKLGIENLEKLVEYLPNVRTASHGPGTSVIYIRGLSTDTPGLQITGTAGSQPNVALYLNDAPSSMPGRNLDVYAVDLQRIEVLAGPQGTLFGASAMGGAVRYITNKPDLKEYHTGFNASYSFTKGGAESTAANAFINIPIIEGKLAARLVLFNDQQGGYIDNVAGTYQMPFNGNVGQAGKLPTGNPTLVLRALGSCVGQGATCTGSGYNTPIRQTINNDNFVKNDFNDAAYAGARLAVTYEINDDWSVDAMHMRQNLKTNGVFDYEQGVGDLKVTQFGPNSLRDDWDVSTLTLNGRLGMLDLVYTGSFLEHTAVQNSDYASYSNIGLYLSYYECDRGVYYNGEANKGNTCYTPNKSYSVKNKNKRNTQEFRVITPADKRLRATGGLFYDQNTLYDNTNWLYTQKLAGFIYPRAPNPIVDAHDGSIRPLQTGFFNDVTRKDRQFAVYGEVSYDIIPDRLTATGGARYYDEQASQTGSSNSSFGYGSRGIYNPATGTYSAAATPPKYFGVSANLKDTLKGLSPANYTGTLLKANLTYRFGDGSLVYATYSDGFRPGGFNRKPCKDKLTKAECDRLLVYVPDTVTNYEVGWKLALLERTLQFNAAAYLVDWDNIQITLFDQNISNQTFTTNLVDARIKGLEGDFAWRATQELTFNGGFSYNDSEITKYRKAATVLVPIGSPLALSPKYQGNLRVRYETELASGLRPYAQAGLHFVDKSISSIIDNVSIKWAGPTITYNGVVVKKGDVAVPLKGALEQKAYTTLSAAVGVNKDNWGVELYGDNLTDERPELYKSGNDGELRVTTSRPMTIGVRLSYRN